MTITIDPEFQSMIPALKDEEREQLKANLQSEGCLDPLIVWKTTPDAESLHAEGFGTCKGSGCEHERNQVPAAEWVPGDGNYQCPSCGYGIAPMEARTILLDGHNRFAICEELGIGYRLKEIELADRDAAADWIDAHQLGRRNLSPEQMSLLRGRRYERAKKSRGGDGSNQHTEQKGQSDPIAKSTAAKLAKEHGVAEKTIKRDAQFARAVDKAKQADPDIEKKIASGNGPSRKRVTQAAKLVEKDPDAAKAVLDGTAPLNSSAEPISGNGWEPPKKVRANPDKQRKNGSEVWPVKDRKASSALLGKLIRSLDGTPGWDPCRPHLEEVAAVLEGKDGPIRKAATGLREVTHKHASQVSITTAKRLADELWSALN